jgi:hypothetical protein
MNLGDFCSFSLCFDTLIDIKVGVQLGGGGDECGK